MEGREVERERGRERGRGTKNEDYMKGAEAGRRERWRKEGEMRGNKTLDSRKLMMSHTT